MIDQRLSSNALESRAVYECTPSLLHRLHFQNTDYRMFESAEQYSSMAQDHVNEALYILTRYEHEVNGGDDEIVLDVGCGSGDVTVQVLGRMKRWKQIVGIDFNSAMIEFANRNAPDVNKYSFEVVNFNKPISEEFSKKKFNKIFSFFALQWMKNRRTVAQNIYDLLAPGGQAFLLLVSYSKIYEIWDDIAESSEWKNHIPFSGPLNELVYAEKPEELVIAPLKDVGLKIVKSEILERKNAFKANEDTDDSKIEKLKTVDPFLKSIPVEKKDRYLEDLLERVKTKIGPNGATDYTALIVIAQKD
ncbi:Acid methyltransferase [Nesidiocoris tenuis]|uniref:Acid methyltransferase n=1 Tax=Nesidiocoris tenuis TaxID=355587 RepID=A0ABN7APL7_9HEMI|nr:Acid methyltransferase [Nesidiocoris tenuis]